MRACSSSVRWLRSNWYLEQLQIKCEALSETQLHSGDWTFLLFIENSKKKDSLCCALKHLPLFLPKIAGGDVTKVAIAKKYDEICKFLHKRCTIDAGGF